MGRSRGACVAASPPSYVSLSTDSNGPLPDTARARRHLRLKGSSPAALPPEGRRLADVRHAVCRRALLPSCSRGCSPRPARQLSGSYGRCFSRRRPLPRRGLLEQHQEVTPVRAPGRTRTGMKTVLQTAAYPFSPPEHQLGVTGRFRSGTAAFTARHAEPLHHDHHGCPRLESNQHLLRFRQAPSPDRLRGHRCGRVVPGHGHRRLFGCQRARSLRNASAGKRGVEPRSLGQEPRASPSKLLPRLHDRPPETKKAAVVSQGGFRPNYRRVRRLAAPVHARLEPKARFDALVMTMLAAEQTIAIRRKHGARRSSFVVEHDQHDLVKVNSALTTVKIFFPTCSGSWRFLDERHTADQHGTSGDPVGQTSETREQLGPAGPCSNG